MDIVTNVPEHLLNPSRELKEVVITTKDTNSEPNIESLNKEQKEAFDQIILFLQGKLPDTRILALIGFAGTGKLNPYTEPILTPNGWVTMKDIVSGSEVIGKHGKPIKVLKTYPAIQKDIYKVSFCDGTYSECCNEHLWKVQTEKMRKLGTYRIMSLQDMIEKVERISKKRSFIYSVDLPDPIQFPMAAVCLHPYLLGVLLGNGYLSENGNVELSMHRDCVEEMFNKIQELLPSDVTIKIAKYQESTPNTGVIRFNTEIKKYLHSLNLIGLKSKDKFVPKEYMYNSIACRYYVLSGLLDTDGCVQDFGNKKKVSFSSTSKTLAENVCELTRSLGSYCKIGFFDRSHDNKGIEYHVTLRTRENPFKLLRKRNIYEKYDWTFRFKKKIISIQYIGKKDGQCILVDDPEHLYITRDYTVTHNTYLITQVLKWFIKYMRNKIAITAPTNKAVKVLRNTANYENPNINYSTIHKLLGLKEDRDNITGKLNFKRDYDGESAIDSYWGLVVDETSMLQDEIFEMLDEEIHRVKSFYDDRLPELHNDSSNLDEMLVGVVAPEKRVQTSLKVLFSGDPVQIPPVGKKDCIPFNPDKAYRYGIDTMFLTEIVRQKEGNPILELATAVRDNFKAQNVPYFRETKITEQGAVCFVSRMDTKTLMLLCERYFANPRFEQDPDFMKVICWTNKVVDFMNTKIRRIIYKNDIPSEDYVLPKIMIGEKLIANSPIVERVSYRNVTVFNTNDEFEVVEYDIKPVEVTKGYSANAYHVKVKHWNTNNNCFNHKHIIILHEDEEKKFAETLDRIKKDVFKTPANERGQKWKFFYSIKEKFADIKYNYCITAHKAQGSTYDNAIVISADINKNPTVEERNRILYVAFTRARHNLFIIE